MPRYKYSCEPCGLNDVKLYDFQKIDGVETKICIHCKTPLGRKFLRPPGEWFNRMRTP